MKSQKTYWPWGPLLGNYIWTNWDQKTYQAITPEPLLQFSQTGPDFFWNYKMNPIKL